MSRVLIIFRQRLGDVVGCLPAAWLLAQAGYEVDFYCLPQYHTLFHAVSYCRPVGPEALFRRAEYHRVYDLEITRARYDDFRRSRKKWRDYIYTQDLDLMPALHEKPIFDRLPDLTGYALPASYNLAAPFGISQVTQVNPAWFRQQCESISQDPWYVLVGRPSQRIEWGTPIYARSLGHLPTLIARAKTFVTINSAPNVIASGVRSTWYQVAEPSFGGQDNYDAPGQIVLRQPPELARYSWRFWVHYWRRKLVGIDVSADKGIQLDS